MHSESHARSIDYLQKFTSRVQLWTLIGIALSVARAIPMNSSRCSAERAPNFFSRHDRERLLALLSVGRSSHRIELTNPAEFIRRVGLEIRSNQKQLFLEQVRRTLAAVWKFSGRKGGFTSSPTHLWTIFDVFLRNHVECFSKWRHIPVSMNDVKEFNYG